MEIAQEDVLPELPSEPVFDGKMPPYLPKLADAGERGNHGDHNTVSIDGECTPPPVVLEPTETCDWDKVIAYPYMHKLVFHGYYSYRKKVGRKFEGYSVEDLEDGEEYDQLGMDAKRGCRCTGGMGTFVVRMGWRRAAMRPYLRYDLELTVFPQCRQAGRFWESVSWVKEVVDMVAQRYSMCGLRLTNIEIPVDFRGDFSRDGLDQCLRRSWGGTMRRKSGTTGSVYDGEAWQGRSDIVYPKDESMHPEARWRRNGLLEREAGCFCDQTVLLLLLEMWSNMQYVYLDPRKLLRSPSCMKDGNFRDFWGMFTKSGIVYAALTNKE
jgi:hypothetical protein